MHASIQDEKETRVFEQLQYFLEILSFFVKQLRDPNHLAMEKNERKKNKSAENKVFWHNRPNYLFLKQPTVNFHQLALIFQRFLIFYFCFHFVFPFQISLVASSKRMDN